VFEHGQDGDNEIAHALGGLAFANVHEHAVEIVEVRLARGRPVLVLDHAAVLAQHPEVEEVVYGGQASARYHMQSDNVILTRDVSDTRLF
jgi:hypothetical protein